MIRAASWQPTSTERWLVRHSLSHISVSASRKGAVSVTPALLTSPSSCPASSRTCRNAARKRSVSVTSTATAPAPASRTRSSPASVISSPQARAPASCTARRMPAPIPAPAPVTAMTFPSSPFISPPPR